MADSRESLIQKRMLEVLKILSRQFPSLSVTVDLLRPKVVSIPEDGYGEDSPEVWVRLAENVPAFYVESMERWYQEGVGVINSNANFIILPADYDVNPDDHIILNGVAWMVIEAAEQAGIAKLKVDRQKSRFAPLPRNIPTYREIGMKLRVA